MAAVRCKECTHCLNSKKDPFQQIKGFVDDLVVLAGGSADEAKRASQVQDAEKETAARRVPGPPIHKELALHQSRSKIPQMAEEVSPELAVSRSDDDFKDLSFDTYNVVFIITRYNLFSVPCFQPEAIIISYASSIYAEN